MDVLLFLIIGTDLEGSLNARLFPGQQLLEHNDTPYGTVSVTHQGNQINFYENQSVLASTGNPSTAESAVHYALIQHPSAKRVLLISGGLASSHIEIFKYPSLEQLDYVELDPKVLEVFSKYISQSNDPRLKTISKDARRFLSESKSTYDAILINLPDPSTLQLNRYFTRELFLLVKDAMKPGGILSFSLTGFANYVTPELRQLSSAVFQSLRSVFPHTLIIPDQRLFFIASENELSYDIARELEFRKIVTIYLTPGYLKAILAPDRIKLAHKAVSLQGPMNLDYFPLSYFFHIKHWLGQTGSGLWPILFFLAGIIFIILILTFNSPSPAASFALSSTGFSTMAIQLALTLGFQICFGYLYHYLSVLITAFMAGTGLGTLLTMKISRSSNKFFSHWLSTHPSRILLFFDSVIALTAFLLPFFVVGVGQKQMPAWVLFGVFAGTSGWSGFLLGIQFPLAQKLLFQTQPHQDKLGSGVLFALDFLGAALGAFLTTSILIPWMGFNNSCYLIGALKLCSVLSLCFDKKTNVVITAHRQSPPGGLFTFSVILFSLLSTGALILFEKTTSYLYVLSFLPIYHWTVVALLGLGIYLSLELNFYYPTFPFNSRLKKILFDLKISFSGLTYYFILSLIVFFPVFKCYFKVPYLFCHSCPRKCVFGFLRPYSIPALLIMNLNRRYWCFQLCPIGTLQKCQQDLPIKKWNFTTLHWYSAIAVLSFTLYSYFKSEHDLNIESGAGHDWYTFFFKNQYHTSYGVLAATLLILLISFKWRRFFCRALCPVGTISVLLQKAEAFLSPKRTTHADQSPT